MAAVWLMRHAPTPANADGVLMGRQDPPPLQAGLEQAALYGTRLRAGRAFDMITSSPLRRATDTARAVFPGRVIVPDVRLAERGFGTWQGRPKAELQAAHPEAFNAAGSLHLHYDPPGAEPLAALLERVSAALDDWRSLGPDATIFAVTHNGVLRVARHLLAGEGLAAASERSLAFLVPVVHEL